MMKLRVAVIGCGAAGLCALRHLTARPELFEATGFEQLTNVGGTWNYTDKVGTYDNGVPVQSSMYKNLKTNLPKEVMAFPDFPFPSYQQSYIGHEAVLKYLEDYCQHFNLQPHIQLNTRIEKVEPTNGKQWKVTCTSNGVTQSDIYDAVMVCNGHYSIPLIPEIPGMDEFKGTIIHSHNYREPAVFKDQVVICLGAGSSGQDICLDIATAAKKVILSHDHQPFTTPLPENLCQKPGIERLTADCVVYKNGESEKIDALLLCTGYKYDFPFLDDACKVDITDERVTPLYKHIIHVEYPTLSFIGVCKKICPFPQFDNQVKFVLSVLDKTQALPTTKNMMADIEKDLSERLAKGMPIRYAHNMGASQWSYNDMLADLGEFEHIPKVWENLYSAVHKHRIDNLMTYKQRSFKVIDEENFIEEPKV